MPPKLDVIFIMGPQGSGKGTQGRILAQKLGFFFWETGAMLREAHELILSDGSKVGDITDGGNYLSDPQLIEFLKSNLSLIKPGTGIIFDGVPRRMGQAKFLMDFLRQQGRKYFLTLLLTLPKEESIKRLLLRAEKEKRVDDTPEAIESRLKLYEEVTLPVIDYLKTQTDFVEIDGRPSIPEIERKIEKALSISK